MTYFFMVQYGIYNKTHFFNLYIFRKLKQPALFLQMLITPVHYEHTNTYSMLHNMGDGCHRLCL